MLRYSYVRISLLIVAANFGGGLAGASANTLAFFDFNGPDDTPYTANFNQQKQGGIPGSGTFAWAADSGILDQAGPAAGGGIGVADADIQDQTTVYKTSSFPVDNGSVWSVSVLAKLLNLGTNGDKPVQIGFLKAADKNFNGEAGYAFASARLFGDRTSEVQVLNLNGNTVSGPLAAAAAISQDSWLKFTLNVQETDATAGTFSLSYQLEDLGPNGTGTSTVLVPWTAPYAATLPSLAGVPLYAGFRTTMAESFDNFMVADPSPAPEPSTLLLLSTGALLLLGWRWRRCRG